MAKVVLSLSIRRTLMVSVSVALACSAAGAQTLTPIIPAATADPDLCLEPVQTGASFRQPRRSVPAPAPAVPPAPVTATTPLYPPPPVSFPRVGAPSYVPGGSALDSALASARRGDSAAAMAAMQQMSDPAARKIVLWAMVDADGEQPLLLAVA